MNHNRRTFFKNLALGAAAFAILPSASTYARIWKPKAIVPVMYKPNPEWLSAEYEINWWIDNSKSALEGGIVLPRKPFGPPLGLDPIPVRFRLDHGTFIQILPYVEV